MKAIGKTQKVGQVGENLASIFLERNGYRIIDRNYRKKWGELDIVAEKDKELHFVEVKAITWVSDTQVQYRPEDNIRLWKKQRMARAIKTYFIDRKLSDEIDFQIDIIAIFLDFTRKKAKIRFLENVILE